MTKENSAPKILQVPEAVRGMTELDLEKFRKTITFPALEFESKDVGIALRKIRLENYLIKNMTKFKYLADSSTEGKKRLLFNPDVVKSEEDREEVISTIKNILPDIELKWLDHEQELVFDNWDAKQAIRAILPENLDFSSFTQTGHIIHCNFRDELFPFKHVIGQILLNKVRNCRTVVNKIDNIQSEFRNFQLELVAGEADYTALVLEAGVKYKMDFSKVFWNSRLSHEHERIWKRFNRQSLVFDACAGVGPFVLPAVKKGLENKVLANDLNPESVRWLKENITLNKIKHGTIEVFNQDAVDFIRGPVADEILKQILSYKEENSVPSASGAHILMNLPAYAINFLPAFKGLFAKSADKLKEITKLPFPIIIYCHMFVKANENVPDEWFVDKAREMVMEKLECPEANIQLIHHIRTVSSYKEMFCVEIEVPLSHLLSQESSIEEPEAKKVKLDS